MSAPWYGWYGGGLQGGEVSSTHKPPNAAQGPFPGECDSNKLKFAFLSTAQALYSVLPSNALWLHMNLHPGEQGASHKSGVGLGSVGMPCYLNKV